MPLHDWDGLQGWEGVHDLWIVRLFDIIKPQLPPQYRAYLGSSPMVSIGEGREKPDVSVRRWQPESPPDPPSPPSEGIEPDEEVATITLDPVTSLFITREGRLVAAVELISPRNKDRKSARDTYLARYLGYLQAGAHLLLVDVHPRPLGFSFADTLSDELRLRPVPLPTPCTIVFRVGEPHPEGGRFLAVWRRALTVGQPLPLVPLPLTVHLGVPVDLEATYSRAADDAYLS